MLSVVGLVFFVFAPFVGRAFAVFLACLMLVYFVISYFASSKIVVKIIGAKEITQMSQSPKLFSLVDNLSITLGIPRPKIYIIEDPAINAFTAGVNPQKSLIGVTTGLLELKDNEVEGVLAHEFGHIMNYDCRLQTIVFFFFGWFLFRLQSYVSCRFVGGLTMMMMD